ncbi:MAG: CooT family nickel-binding protein [Oscillospiraceae bacterium]|nr:CooT family nickel-binding protein [Oscillospiraceae bacterium]
MCLSTAYAVGSGSEKFIADRITNVDVEDGKVRLTTLLGTQTLVDGLLKSVDLNKNVIYIEEKQ